MFVYYSASLRVNFKFSEDKSQAGQKKLYARRKQSLLFIIFDRLITYKDLRMQYAANDTSRSHQLAGS